MREPQPRQGETRARPAVPVSGEPVTGLRSSYGGGRPVGMLLVAPGMPGSPGTVHRTLGGQCRAPFGSPPAGARPRGRAAPKRVRTVRHIAIPDSIRAVAPDPR